MVPRQMVVAFVSIVRIISVGAFVSPTSRCRCTPPHHSKCQPLMGIKGFRSWFETAFPSAVVKINTDKPPRPINGKNNVNGRGKNNDSQFQPEEFDHVLIDANQFLHSNLRKAFNRRAKSERSLLGADDEIIEHSMLLFLKEINDITTNIAVPKKSLVIAIDGSPAAAKLDLQRGRRSSIYKKAYNQERQVRTLKEQGWRDNDFGFYSNKLGKKQTNPLLTKHLRERISLGITPGTAFMDQVKDALLYWAWQYVTRFPNIRVYLSPSSVHGEGEVKLLDWIMHGHDHSGSGEKGHRINVRESDTVAILGGDSDLVLMGLVVNPSITHNIHVILPGERSKSLVVSVWETTRRMARMLEGTAEYGKKGRTKPKGRNKKITLTPSQINQVRIDTSLLIIMNGNDYLPKLRGCRAGFDVFFTTYLDLVKMCLEKQDDGDDDAVEPFLITSDDRNQLYLNVPFAILFFEAMTSESQISWPTDSADDRSNGQNTELGTLTNLVEAKILPGPATFTIIEPEDSVFQRELWEMNSKLNQNTSDVINEVFADGAEIVRLTMGKFPEDLQSPGYEVKELESDGHGVIARVSISKSKTKPGGRAYLFEVPHRQQHSLKAAKYRLACIALEECFGKNYEEVLFGNGDDEDEMDLSSARDMPQGLADAHAASYLGGLLWNLLTYQQGCCFDYGYDYGRRASPTPFELVDFLESLEEQGKSKIRCVDLIERTTTTPLCDGLSCLAALPPQAHRLVPEPYRWLVDSSSGTDFEAIYNSCFCNEAATFNLQQFETECNAELARIREQREYDQVLSVNGKVKQDKNKKGKGRRIYAGSQSWTVLSYSNIPINHPFEPPEPFCDRVRRLRKNKKIRASKLPVKDRIEFSTNKQRGSIKGPEKQENQSVLDLPYNTAYQKNSR